MSKTIQLTGFDKYGKALFDYKSNDKTTYTVKDGDTLLTVTNLYHVGMQQLRFYNNISKLTFAVRVGQVLHIPNGQVIIPASDMEA